MSKRSGTFFLVPSATVDTKTDPEALGTLERRVAVRRTFDPAAQPGFDLGAEDGRLAVAPILPGEELIPAPPVAAGQRLVIGMAGERQIADRDRLRPTAAEAAMHGLLAEGEQLLDITERQAGLGRNPASQTRIEVLVLARQVEAVRQPVGAAAFARGAKGQDPRLVVGNGCDGGVEADFQYVHTALPFRAAFVDHAHV